MTKQTATAHPAARRDNVEYHKGAAARTAGEPETGNPYTPNPAPDSRFARWALGWKETAAPAPVREYIDITPTWRAAASIYIACLEAGTETGRRAAREDIRRMAGLADERNELAARVALLEAVATCANETAHCIPEGMARDEMRDALTAAGYAV